MSQERSDTLAPQPGNHFSSCALRGSHTQPCLCHPQPGVSLLGSGFPTGAPGASVDIVEDEESLLSVPGLGSAVVGSEDTVI